MSVRITVGLTRVQIGALTEIVTRHASDEADYLQTGGASRDYTDAELPEVAETREHIWRNCAQALEEIGAASGEIEEVGELADRWAALKKVAVAE